MSRLDPSVLLIIIANILFSFKGFNDASHMYKYMFEVGGIKRKEYYRMLSSGFLHVDTSHLIFNMLTLYFFAPVVINSMSRVDFLLVYFISLLAGNFLSYYYHRQEDSYRAVGASGAVFGVLFASILLYPDMSLYLFFIPIPIPAIVVGIGYLFFTVFGMEKRWGNIGHSAHLGGAIAGLLVSVLRYPVLLKTRMLVLGLLLVPILFFIFYERYKK
jgi:membrane associated rhomboid family serine protease